MPTPARARPRELAAALMIALAGCSGGGGGPGGSADGAVDARIEVHADAAMRPDGELPADAARPMDATPDRPTSGVCVPSGAPARSVRRLTANNGAELAGDVSGHPEAA